MCVRVCVGVLYYITLHKPMPNFISVFRTTLCTVNLKKLTVAIK